MPTNAAFTPLGDEHFVLLTTFRKTGEAVSTTVWIARDGDDLIVTTPRDSGKVKRIRNDGRVELRPCNRFGRVRHGAPVANGIARILDDDESREHQASVFHSKLGFEYRLFMFFERRSFGRQGKAGKDGKAARTESTGKAAQAAQTGQKQRVMLRISPA